MRKLIAVLVLLSLMFSTVTVTAQEGGPVNQGKGRQVDVEKSYIVQMADNPVVAYDGDIRGLKATRPKQGQKIDPNSPAVVAYVTYLQDKHNAALNGVGGGRKLYDYQYTFNGFAAVMSEEQAAALAKTAGVLAVTPNELVSADTSNTPAFLGLNAEGGLWDQVGGVENAGEDVIIGIIDSGIWPESLSFSDRTGENGNASKDGKLSYQQLPGWHGKCVPGDAFAASDCNQKLIGAQYFNEGFGGNAGIDALRPWEYNSPRGYNGHGTHTASTAGGNYNVPTDGPAAAFGAISGIAPRARIAVYKGLWHDMSTGGSNGFSVDLVAAIDQAVADGVDVINYSISGTLTNFLDPVAVAFLFAADAGIFVAQSAGNSGPTTSTVAHPGPWTTTVAAGTHNRSVQGSVTLGNGATYSGASVAAYSVSGPFIYAGDAALPGVDPGLAALCYAAVNTGGTPVLDPAVVSGKIVLCDRGVTARVDKSRAVMEAGGIGMVLVNVTASTLNNDFHVIPTVHLQNTDRAAVLAYAQTAGATATINAAVFDYATPAPFTASFSSRGPLRAGNGDLLKPDVIAPGQDILAAVSPDGDGGLNFNLYSGTSMSSPHVAGLAALLMDAHPDWTPMMIKSALMTTAYDVLDNTTVANKIFRQGAGHVDPNLAVDPGLVFDAGFLDWLAFLCGSTNGVSPTTCAALKGMGYSFDPSDMNVASIAIGDLAGAQTVVRKVTNVGSATETYTASVAELAGATVAIDPAVFTLEPGQTQKLNITITRTDAAFYTYTGGFISWNGDQGHVVRIPVVVRPVAVSAPAEVTGSGASGSLSFDVKFSYSGSYAAIPFGLVPAVTFNGVVPDDPTDTFVVGGPGIVSYDVVVPAGSQYTRFQLFDEYTDGEDDLDLYVYRGQTLVGSSGSGTSAEQVNVLLPSGTYTVYVHGWGTDGPDAAFTLFTWVLGTDAGNMTVTAPTQAVIYQTAPINVAWSGLAPATKYLGLIGHGTPALTAPSPRTIISIDVP